LGIHISITNHTFNCETAWSPCIKFVQKVYKKYELSASVEFSEPGVNFAGIYDINENGELVKEVNMECEVDVMRRKRKIIIENMYFIFWIF
jgi:hypothetical protein